MHPTLESTCYFLFGMSGWWIFNTLSAEQPIFTLCNTSDPTNTSRDNFTFHFGTDQNATVECTLPEGRALSSQISVTSQLGNIVPLLYRAIVKYCCSERKGANKTKKPALCKCDRSVRVPAVILVAMAVGLFSAVLAAFEWQNTMYILGDRHSVILLVCCFLSGGLGCMSSIVYWQFASMYSRGTGATKALSIGMAAGGLFPCVLALLQNLDQIFPKLSDVYFSPQTMLLISSGIQAFFIALFVCIWMSNRNAEESDGEEEEEEEDADERSDADTVEAQDLEGVEAELNGKGAGRRNEGTYQPPQDPQQQQDALRPKRNLSAPSHSTSPLMSGQQGNNDGLASGGSLESKRTPRPKSLPRRKAQSMNTNLNVLRTASSMLTVFHEDDLEAPEPYVSKRRRGRSSSANTRSLERALLPHERPKVKAKGKHNFKQPRPKPNSNSPAEMKDPVASQSFLSDGSEFAGVFKEDFAQLGLSEEEEKRAALLSMGTPERATLDSSESPQGGRPLEEVASTGGASGGGDPSNEPRKKGKKVKAKKTYRGRCTLSEAIPVGIVAVLYFCTYSLPALIPVMINPFPNYQSLYIEVNVGYTIGDFLGRMVTVLPWVPKWSILQVLTLVVVGLFVLQILVAIFSNQLCAALLPENNGKEVTSLVNSDNYEGFGYALIATQFLYYFLRGYVVTNTYVRIKTDYDEASSSVLAGAAGTVGQVGAAVGTLIAFLLVSVFRVFKLPSD